jgi:DNA-directed RNA polymerase subunit N (RpoN/RPB10)
MYHVRCFSCGKVFCTNCWVAFLASDEELKMNVLKSFHIKRYCCTRMFLSYVDDDIFDRTVYVPQTNNNSTERKESQNA